MHSTLRMYLVDQTDRQRWEACGKPEIICTECLHVGDDVAQRVCEVCSEDEPAGDEHGPHCPACDHEVCWVPRCPDCGAPATWTYGTIKPREFQCIQAHSTFAPSPVPAPENGEPAAARIRAPLSPVRSRPARAGQREPRGRRLTAPAATAPTQPAKQPGSI